MSKFKVGDRVLCTGEDFNGMCGEVCVVDPRPNERLPYLVNFGTEAGPIVSWKRDADLCFATPSPNTVRVRIAVAVAENGDWCGYGGADNTDAKSSKYATEGMAEGRRISFITADVPLPERPAEIQGVVE